MEDKIENIETDPFYEVITIEKFYKGDRIKFMSFTVKASEKSDLSKLIMDLLIKITEHKGYTSYFDSKNTDSFASLKKID